MLPTMQFGGRSNRSTWQYPGVATAQYWTGQPVLPPPSGCERVYGMDRAKTWYSHSAAECKALGNIGCPSSEQSFVGPCGCGCEPKQAPTKYLCAAKDRSAHCQINRAPVCGTKAMSAGRVLNITFQNGCVACKDPNVDYYVQGRC